MNTESILTFKNVDKFNDKGGKKLDALKNISFRVEPGQLTLINGPSGAGKTTLIYLAGLLKKPSRGEIEINGIVTSDLDENKRSKIIREEIGFVFRRSNLLPHLNVIENVMLPMLTSNQVKAEDLLAKVEIDDWHRFPNDLTFEEEQKVALARSLVNDPSLILADEPTAELDWERTHDFIKLLKKLDISVLMTSDNNSLAGSFNQTIQLDNGRLKLVSVK